MLVVPKLGISDALKNPIDFNTSLQTRDKDANLINLIGYLGELTFIGDIEFGNETLIVSGIVDGVNQYLGYSQVGSESIGYELSFNDATDPENIVELQKFISNSNRIQTEFKWEDRETTRPEGYIYNFLSNVDQVLVGDLLQTFNYGGYNDELSDTVFVSDEISSSNITATEESGIYRKYIMLDGVRTLALTVDENGITHGLVTRKSATLRVSDLGTAYLEYDRVESNLDSGIYHTSQAGGLSLPADNDNGFTRLCIFALATGGDAEAYINLGDSGGCKFRKIVTL